MQLTRRPSNVSILYPPGKQRIELWGAVAKHLNVQTPAERIARQPWMFLNRANQFHKQH